MYGETGIGRACALLYRARARPNRVASRIQPSEVSARVHLPRRPRGVYKTARPAPAMVAGRRLCDVGREPAVAPAPRVDFADFEAFVARYTAMHEEYAALIGRAVAARQPPELGFSRPGAQVRAAGSRRPACRALVVSTRAAARCRALPRAAAR